MLFLALIHFIKFRYCVCDVDLLINGLRPFRHCAVAIRNCASLDRWTAKGRVAHSTGRKLRCCADNDLTFASLLSKDIIIFQKEYLNKLSCPTYTHNMGDRTGTRMRIGDDKDVWIFASFLVPSADRLPTWELRIEQIYFEQWGRHVAPPPPFPSDIIARPGR